MAAPSRDVGGVSRSLASVGSRVAPSPARLVRIAPPTRAEVDRVVTAFVREYIRSTAWEVIVPGEHDGGITHQDLFGVLASQGRDFFQPTVQLFQAVQRALRDEFYGASALPSIAALKSASEPALLEHIELRLSKRGNADVMMQPLTPAYAARKRRLGRGSQPIGVASGELRRAYSRDARVVWKR